MPCILPALPSARAARLASIQSRQRTGGRPRWPPCVWGPGLKKDALQVWRLISHSTLEWLRVYRVYLLSSMGAWVLGMAVEASRALQAASMHAHCISTACRSYLKWTREGVHRACKGHAH